MRMTTKDKGQRNGDSCWAMVTRVMEGWRRKIMGENYSLGKKEVI